MGSDAASADVTFFFAGDVMLGRGVDQILPHPSSPELYENYVRDARHYVELAEGRSGRIPHPVDFVYPWGDALDEMRRADARIINLETSITRRSRPWPNKEVHYRMHPANIGCITAAGIDVCALANNHVLDWGREGLAETIATLHTAHVRTAGAGATRAQAEAPAVVPLPPGGRVVVFSFGSTSSGVPTSWKASSARSGVALLPDLSSATADRLGALVRAVKEPGDVVVASIHWGPNYGWDVPDEFVDFAHAIVERGVDILHGHSSHHVRGVEKYAGRLVLYGCGDFIDDYEAIDPDEFRLDLGIAWFVTCDARNGALRGLRMMPTRTRRMRLERASVDDARWLAKRLEDASARFGTRIEVGADDTITL